MFWFFILTICFHIRVYIPTRVTRFKDVFFVNEGRQHIACDWTTINRERNDNGTMVIEKNQ